MMRKISHLYYILITCLVYFLFCACSRTFLYVRWSATILNSSTSNPKYAYWYNGQQVYHCQSGDVEAYLLGSSDDDYIYLMCKIVNHSNIIINLYPFHSRLIQMGKGGNTEFLPIRPRQIRANAKQEMRALSLYYTLSSIKLRLKASETDKLANEYQKDRLEDSYYAGQTAISNYSHTFIDIMLKNHTLLPGEEYNGCLAFRLVSQSEVLPIVRTEKGSE